MNDGGEKGRRPRYTLKPVITPLPSWKDADSREGVPVGEDEAAQAGRPNGAPGASPVPRPAPRAENEDDDGYDPYSDYHDGTAGDLAFDPDPWR